MPRGGARPGAGRKKGAFARLTETRRERLVAAAVADRLPLEIMLERMRELWNRGTEEDKDKAVSLAIDCAPYMHPRLAAVQHSGNKDEPIAYEIVSSVPRPMIEHVNGDDRTAIAH